MATAVEKSNPKQKTSITISHKQLYIGGALIAVLFWSTSFVGTKIAYESFAPLTLGAVRFAIAAIILGIIKLSIKDRSPKPSFKDMGWIALSGLLGTTLYFALENVGLKMTTASNAALIIASYPAMAALFEFAFYRTKISWIKGLGILLAITGVYQLSSGSPGQGGEQHIMGNLILILAGVVFSFYTFTTRKVVSKYSMLTISFYQTLTGAIAFIPLALIEKSTWKMPTAQSWAMAVYLGVFCSVVAFFLYNLALRHLAASTAVALMNLVPVFGVILSVWVLGEVIGGGQYFGGLIVIIGVMLSMKETKQKPVALYDLKPPS